MTDFTPHESVIRSAQAFPVPMPPKLVGRDTALAQVYGQLKAFNPVLLHGPGGVGKTALAVTLASAYAQQPGGVLWLTVNNPRLEELLVMVGRAYQIREVTTTENPLGLIAGVENTLRAQKPLVVLDGAIQPEVATRFIERCIDGVPLIITHAEKIQGPWAALEVTKLEPAHALALFKQEARLTIADFDAQIAGIVTAVDYVPLGIIVAARTMVANKMTPNALLADLQKLSGAAGGGNPMLALTIGFAKLTGALQGILLMVGATYEGHLPAELLGNLSGAPLDSVQQAMNILAQLGFVERSVRYGQPYYRLHPLVYEFAQAGLRRSNKLDGLQDKFRDTVFAYIKKYQGGTENDYNKLAAAMDNIMALARWLAEKGDNAVINDLVVLLSQTNSFINSRGYVYDLVQLRSTTGIGQAFPAYPKEETTAETLALFEQDDDENFIDDDDFDDDDFDEDFDDDEEVAAPDFLSSMESGGSPLDAISVAANELESSDLDVLRTTLARTRQSSDVMQQIKVLQRIGDVQVEQSMENEAIATYNEILSLYEQEEDQDGELETLDMLAALMAKTENSQAAVMHAGRGVTLARTLGDRENEMQLLITLGDARQQLGESGAAADDYTNALEIARTRDDAQHEAIILYKLGYAQLDDGNADMAIRTWEQALTLFRNQDKREYEGRVLGGLGDANGDLERWPEAMKYHASALHLAREAGDKLDESIQLNSLAYAAYKANQLAEAVMRYRQALHLAYDSNNQDNIVSIIVDLSRLLLQHRPYVSIAELLINDALTFETNDKDVNQLATRIQSEKELAAAYGTALKRVSGTAQDYAANAYKALDG